MQAALSEQCDDGNRNALDDCDNACRWTRLPECGDGILQPDYEQCDSGPYNGDYSGTSCRANCTLPYCGDGTTDANEECDDGNRLSGDGCSAVCTKENPAAPPPVQGNLVPPVITPPVTTTPYEEPPEYVGTVPTPARTPTGPGLAIFLASGAAAGIGLGRRGRRK